jgi:hypothetical protein
MSINYPKIVKEPHHSGVVGSLGIEKVVFQVRMRDE